MKAHEKYVHRLMGKVDGSYRRAPEAFFGTNPRNIEIATVNADFEAAKARTGNPDMNISEFLSSHMSPATRQHVVAAIGETGLQWAIETDPRKMLGLRDQMYRQLLLLPPDFDCGPRMSWFFDRASEAQRIELGREFTKPANRRYPVPMDAPMPSGKPPTFTKARQRANIHVGFMAINYGREGANIVLRSTKMGDMVADAGLRGADMNRLTPPVAGQHLPLFFRDAFIMVRNGYAPIMKGERLPDGEPMPKRHRRRAELEGKMQLFSLLDEAPASVREKMKPANPIDVLDMSPEELAQLADKIGTDELEKLMPGKAKIPGRNPFMRMNAKEALQHARRDPNAPGVKFVTAEIEHRLAQRSARTMDALGKALGLPKELHGRFMRAAGLVDPANVAMMTPWDHAAEDVRAAHSHFDLMNGVFSGNKRRSDRFGNILVPEGELPDHVSLDGMTPGQKAAATAFLSQHPDAPRAINGLLGAEPARLREILDIVADPKFQKAMDSATGDTKTALNRFLGLLNAAAKENGVLD